MRIFTCTDFPGHWPVGTSAVIVAESEDTARTALIGKLIQIGLCPKLGETLSFTEVDTAIPNVTILQDGNY